MLRCHLEVLNRVRCSSASATTRLFVVEHQHLLLREVRQPPLNLIYVQPAANQQVRSGKGRLACPIAFGLVLNKKTIQNRPPALQERGTLTFCQNGLKVPHANSQLKQSLHPLTPIGRCQEGGSDERMGVDDGLDGTRSCQAPAIQCLMRPRRELDESTACENGDG